MSNYVALQIHHEQACEMMRQAEEFLDTAGTMEEAVEAIGYYWAVDATIDHIENELDTIDRQVELRETMRQFWAEFGSLPHYKAM